ncbi:hypothetical protein C8R46DRAFT_1216920 [Mycena filopes]|nr:hypothetical protein C8R46DRAFT_1216920 [Mycena filopes]
MEPPAHIQITQQSFVASEEDDRDSIGSQVTITTDRKDRVRKLPNSALHNELKTIYPTFFLPSRAPVAFSQRSKNVCPWPVTSHTSRWSTRPGMMSRLRSALRPHPIDVAVTAPSDWSTMVNTDMEGLFTSTPLSRNTPSTAAKQGHDTNVAAATPDDWSALTGTGGQSLAATPPLNWDTYKTWTNEDGDLSDNTNIHVSPQFAATEVDHDRYLYETSFAGPIVPPALLPVAPLVQTFGPHEYNKSPPPPPIIIISRA